MKKGFNLERNRKGFNPERSRRGFALLYALMYVFLVMITVTTVTALAMSEIRQSKKAESTAGAYQVAVSGMDDGLTRRTINPDIEFCGDTDSDDDGKRLEDINVNGTDDTQGKYDLEICKQGSGKKAHITSTGYYKDSKVTLYNEIDKTANGKKGSYIYQIGQ